MWDLAGQDRFIGLVRTYYMHAGAAIVVFDLFDRYGLNARGLRNLCVDSFATGTTGERRAPILSCTFTRGTPLSLSSLSLFVHPFAEPSRL